MGAEILFVAGIAEAVDTDLVLEDQVRKPLLRNIPWAVGLGLVHYVVVDFEGLSIQSMAH